jgi:uncharacterized protein YunC (DUF1805 family)
VNRGYRFGAPRPLHTFGRYRFELAVLVRKHAVRIAISALSLNLCSCTALIKHAINSTGSIAHTMYGIQPAIHEPGAGEKANVAGIAGPINLDSYVFAECQPRERPEAPASARRTQAHQEAAGGPVQPAATAQAPQSPGSGTACQTAYAEAVSDQTGINRNRLEAVLLRRSDLICSEMKSEIVGTNDFLNFTFGEGTTILAGASAVVTGMSASRILAGLAAMTNATRSQINEVFYDNALKAAIVQKIDDMRSAKLSEIKKSSSTTTGAPKPLNTYSTEQMLVDVQNYNDLCSFYSGVTGLTQSSTAYTPQGLQDIIGQYKKALTGR